MTTAEEQPQLTLVDLTEEERRRIARSPVFGYIRARGKKVPFDQWKEGQKLFVGNSNDSIRRTIYRSASKYGIAVSSESDGRDALFTHMGETGEKARPKSPNLFSRSWDPVMSNQQVVLMRNRRAHPDGVERRVEVKLRGGIAVNEYPWTKMRDGDFFYVRMKTGSGREERSLRNGFRDAGNRHDFEIQVVRWNINHDGEESPGLRVTRIQPGLADLKRRAAHRLGEVPVISKGRKVHVPKTRQNTLVKAAIAAGVKAGVAEEKMLALFPEYKPEERGEYLVPRAVQEDSETEFADPGPPSGMGTEDEAEEPHEFVLGAGYELSGVPDLEIARDAAAQQDDVPARKPARVAEDRDDAAPVDVEPAEPAVLGRQFRHGELTEVAVIDTRGIDPELLKGSTYDPAYDRRKILAERLAKLREE